MEREQGKVREPGVDLLKTAAIILVVVSHVVQTLGDANGYIPYQDYVVDLSAATTDPQWFIMTMLRYSGGLGNTIFFVCSAWFLLDSGRANKKKLLRMLLDVWLVSVIILAITYVLRDGDIRQGLMMKQLFPVTFQNNWYVTAYLLFYPLHPILNRVIDALPQRTMLRLLLGLFALYFCINYAGGDGFFYASPLMAWITAYFAAAYMKRYLGGLADDRRKNMAGLLVGIAGNWGVVLVTNFLGLRFEAFADKLLYWNHIFNPFLLLTAFCLFHLARDLRFEGRQVSRVAKLSLLIYIIHENMLLRTYYRPMLWNYVYQNYGYDHILLWTFLLAIAVFLFGMCASILYRQTIQRLTAAAADWVYPRLASGYRRFETRILKRHEN